ncbi:MAG: GDP-mannose 4,6-dehydratase [Bdellovibrio sp.]|nr:GDP-mannose 4,6-dehydratase [Bdellovibrio sp.]
MKHIIITGGAGFIGSHLCEAFLNSGFAVTAIDNLVTGRKENLKALQANPAFHLLVHDVSLPFDEDQIPGLNRHGLHGILHFACPASPVDFEKIPIEILKVDSLGTIHTVDLALKYRSRYLLASTSEIYGDPLVHPQPETYWGNVNTIGPRACYDETKRFAEAYVSTAARYKNLNAGIVRIFNTYGPRMRLDDGRIVPELCRQALRGEPMTIHGTGLQTRSFCYVSDLVDGIVRLFNSQVNVPVNLGNPVERTLLEFATVLQKITGSTTAVQHLPAREDDPKRRCPDIQRARTLLGWSPSVDLEQGLQLSLDYFQSVL